MFYNQDAPPKGPRLLYNPAMLQNPEFGYGGWPGAGGPMMGPQPGMGFGVEGGYGRGGPRYAFSFLYMSFSFC